MERKHAGLWELVFKNEIRADLIKRPWAKIAQRLFFIRR